MNHLTNGQWKNRIVLEIETSEEVGAEEEKKKKLKEKLKWHIAVAACNIRLLF